jgi:hypothetical protein
MPATYFGNDISQDITESHFSHGVLQHLLALLEIVIHAVLGRIPVKAGMSFFKDIPEYGIILIQLLSSELFIRIIAFAGYTAG